MNVSTSYNWVTTCLLQQFFTMVYMLSLYSFFFFLIIIIIICLGLQDTNLS